MTWTTTATLPQTQTGPSWTTTATLPTRQTGSGWFTLLEKVASLSGEGSLSATAATNYPYSTAALGGTGTLTAVIAPRKTIAAAFTTVGSLTAAVNEIKSVTVSFTAGSTQLGAAINDGLWAVIGGGTPLTDGLSAIIVGGLFDGLSATVTAGSSGGSVPMSATLTTTGNLTGTVIGYEMAKGQLTATVIPAANVAAAFTAGGSLSATVSAMSTGAAAAAFTGTGALSATVKPTVPITAALSSSGTLAATINPIITSSAALAGTGTLTAAVVQQFGITAEFGDPAGIVYATLDLTGEGMLTATLDKGITTTLTGVGTLAATVTAAAPTAITYDAVGAGLTRNAAGTLNWSHTITGNGIIVCHITYQGSAPTVSATCGGVAMTALKTSTATGATNTYVTVFGLLSPPTGSQTVAVTSTGTFNAANSVSYNNVASFGTPVFTTGASGTAMTAAVPSTSDQMVCQCFTGYSNPAWSAYNQTARYSNGYEAGGNMAIHIGDAVGDSALTFTITPSTSVLWSSTAIPVVP